jgi:hypothetical protein
MKITELNPPAERKFSIEITESELQHLTLIVGQGNSLSLENLIEKQPWRAEGFKKFVYNSNLIQPLYNTLLEAARS